MILLLFDKYRTILSEAKNESFIFKHGYVLK